MAVWSMKLVVYIVLLSQSFTRLGHVCTIDRMILSDNKRYLCLIIFVIMSLPRPATAFCSDSPINIHVDKQPLRLLLRPTLLPNKPGGGPDSTEHSSLLLQDYSVTCKLYSSGDIRAAWRCY
jgi:hypothetical protein